MKDLCFWSIGVGKHAFMLQALVDSYRAVGMKEDFHVFCDKEINGAITHPIRQFTEFEEKTYFFKFTFLQSFMKQLDYRYFVFLDADNYFIRPLPDILHLMEKSPIHSFLESDCAKPSPRKFWHDHLISEYVEMMRQCGVTGEKVYNVNSGFFIVKREAIDIVCELAKDFWEHCCRKGYIFKEEPALAYATHMLCEDPEKHLLHLYPNIWCTDWTGEYAGRLPDGRDWIFMDYLHGEFYLVNPAIVHAFKSKEALIAAAMKSNPSKKINKKYE